MYPGVAEAFQLLGLTRPSHSRHHSRWHRTVGHDPSPGGEWYTSELGVANTTRSASWTAFRTSVRTDQSHRSSTAFFQILNSTANADYRPRQAFLFHNQPKGASNEADANNHYLLKLNAHTETVSVFRCQSVHFKGQRQLKRSKSRKVERGKSHERKEPTPARSIMDLEFSADGFGDFL